MPAPHERLNQEGFMAFVKAHYPAGWRALEWVVVFVWLWRLATYARHLAP